MADYSHKQLLTYQTLAIMVSVLTVVIPATWYLSTRITRLETQVEGFMGVGGRFTKSDGQNLERRVQVLEMDVKEMPPDWFRRYVDDLTAEVKEHLNKHEADFDRHEREGHE